MYLKHHAWTVDEEVVFAKNTPTFWKFGLD